MVLGCFEEKNRDYLVLNSYDGIEQGSGLKLAIGESSDAGLSFKNVQAIIEPSVADWDSLDMYQGSITKVDDMYKEYY